MQILSVDCDFSQMYITDVQLQSNSWLMGYIDFDMILKLKLAQLQLFPFMTYAACRNNYFKKKKKDFKDYSFCNLHTCV